MDTRPIDRQRLTHGIGDSLDNQGRFIYPTMLATELDQLFSIWIGFHFIHLDRQRSMTSETSRGASALA